MVKRIVWTEQAWTDLRSIEFRRVRLQVLNTLAFYAQKGRGNIRQLQDIEPPTFRLRAQANIFFRDKGDHLEISRVLDRKEAYR